MNAEEKQELQNLCETIESAMYEVENILRNGEPSLYEQWKAGGKQVTSEFVSMYPSLPEVLEKIEVEAEDEEDDDSHESMADEDVTLSLISK
jgi:hypothetical protein